MLCKQIGDLSVRDFADYYGIPKDGNRKFKWMFNSVSFKVSLFGTEKINMRVEQGYEMKWSSLIHIRAEEIESKNNVRLGEK